MHKGAIWLLILLAGCQTTSNNVGQGPRPQLSGQVAKFFEDYKAIPGNNKAFAISMNGQAAGASHCAEGGLYGRAASSLDEGRCSNTEFMALNGCRAKAAGSPCFIYAWGNDIVWGGTQQVTPQTAQHKTPPTQPAQPAANAPSEQIRKFVAIWEGVAGPVSGEVRFSTTPTAAAVKLSANDGLACDGVATFGKNGKGQWVMKCNDDMLLSGSFTETGTNRDILGEGRDAKGRKITFAVAPL